ncbi:COP1-interacting protein 7 [Cryptomeria japonica]|uniref:COP1-interacting protein 7 n=1 Tax=Cryptomeria japonica TaxID=3369 RepID=UPI0025AC404A|nr:COP1-interacting protein 7 [Cryptomeria japonica]
MKAETRLHSAVFQLTPTRTRCELVISAEGETEKLASGLLKPFLTHLKTAEEQIAKGGYSIRLEPPIASNQHATWFTKGTIERFVRFVSTPEVLERVDTIETEIIQIEEAIAIQCSDAFVTEEQTPKSISSQQKEASRPILDEDSESAIVPYKSRRHSVDGIEPAHGGNSKACLLRVLETRKIVLQKEQGMAFARATAAGFDMEHMQDLCSFADCFGAFRLREACIKFTNLWKKKQETGLWLEEMDLETMETSSTRSEMALMNASGITLTSESVIVQRLKPKDFPDGWSDVTSEVGNSKISSHDDMTIHGKSNVAEGSTDANGENTGLNYNRENKLSLEGQVSPALAGNNDFAQGHFQQPMMPVWTGQAPQHMQNFLSYGVGPQPTMQGLPGFHMQGAPYYHGNPSNPPFYQGVYPQADNYQGLGVPPQHLQPRWPLYAEDPRFATAQMTESSAMTGMSLDMKHHSINERDTTIKSETSDTGSPKSLSKSLNLLGQDTDSEPEREYMPSQELNRHLHRRSKSPHRRSSSPHRKIQIGRAGNKRSGMVVIRNINYITSKRSDKTGRDDISENSNSEMDSNGEDDLKQQAEDVQLCVHDMIGLFEKRQESAESLTKKQGSKYSADSQNSRNNKGNGTRNDPATEADQKDDENESWSIFQKYLLQDDESTQNNIDNVDNVDQGGKQKTENVDDMIVAHRDVLGSKGWEANNVIRLEQELVPKKKEQDLAKDSFILPERVREDALLDGRGIGESEKSSIPKKSITYDDLFVSREVGQTTSDGASSDPFASGEFKYTTNQQSDYLRTDKSYGQGIGDDSFMVSTRSIPQYQTGNEWRTIMNIDSELSAEKEENSSHGMPHQQHETTNDYECDELYIMPERISERESLGVLWDPAMDYKMQANMADKVDPHSGHTGIFDEIKSPEDKANSKMKENPKSKKSEKDLQLKVMQEVLEKRKAEMAARIPRLGKPNPLAEAQMRAEKLRVFKANLQKTKKEMEERERNRLEQLKIQRQKRIAARRSSSPTSSSSTSQTMKPQLKTGHASTLLSPSSQKGRTSRNLSPGGSFPSPSGSRYITRSSSEITNDVMTRKKNLQSRTKPTGTSLSRSVPSLSELKKEQEGTYPVSRRLSATKKSTDQIISSKNGKEGSIKPNGTTTHATARALDNLDHKKRHLTATRKSIVTGSESKNKDTSLQKSSKHTSVLASQKGKGSILAADVGNKKSEGNLETNISSADDNDAVLQDEEKCPESVEPGHLMVRAEVSVELKDQENGSISDKSEMKAGLGSGCVPISVPASTNAGGISSQGQFESLLESCHAMQPEAVFIRTPVSLVEENEIEKVCQRESVPFSSYDMHNTPHSVDSDVREDEKNVVQASSSIIQRSNTNESYQAPLARMTSFEDTSYNKFSAYDAPLAPETSSGPPGIFIPRDPVSENNSPLALSSDFPNLSSLSQNVPNIPQFTSPTANCGSVDASHSRQKGSSGEKPKDSSKGFKRLLKFGRKGHNSSTPAINADANQLREMGSRTSEDQGGRLEATIDSGTTMSQLSGGAISDNGISSQAHSLGNLISHDDNSSATHTHKASRSFFSLSNFRSKGSETKSR